MLFVIRGRHLHAPVLAVLPQWRMTGTPNLISNKERATGFPRETGEGRERGEGKSEIGQGETKIQIKHNGNQTPHVNLNCR
jgi:hypothetical protein